MASLPRRLDYDEKATVAMLAALLECPEPKRLDTLAAICQLYIKLVDVPSLTVTVSS